MDTERIIDRLEGFIDVLPALAGSVGTGDAGWKPDGASWSVVEIVAHLADEEVEDFRTRVRLTLADPGQPWPPIDPEGWARERNYQNRDLGPEIDRWVVERRASIVWLRSLASPAWDNAFRHPRFGPIHAGDVLASWAAHDALHARQIAKRLWQLAKRDSGVFNTSYAGDCSA